MWLVRLVWRLLIFCVMLNPSFTFWILNPLLFRVHFIVRVLLQLQFFSKKGIEKGKNIFSVIINMLLLELNWYYIQHMPLTEIRSRVGILCVLISFICSWPSWIFLFTLYLFWKAFFISVVQINMFPYWGQVLDISVSRRGCDGCHFF